MNSPSTTGLIQRLPRHLKMNELRVFVAVLEHRSFRKAAAVLHLSQPAVTKAIAGLEQTLDVKLFDRVANGVEPTVHGRSFAPRAVAVFDELRRAAQDLTLLSSGAQGSLRVGTVPMPAIPFLPVAINRLVDAHPGVFLSVVEERETELLDRLRKRDIEIAILRLALVEPGDDMQAVPLFNEKLCVIANKNHRALVYYWYQGRGRISANEYRVKWELIRDAAFRRRTDEALVRIVVPAGERDPDDQLEQLAQTAARALVVDVGRVLPE